MLTVIVPGPMLQVLPSGSVLLICWPATNQGFTLETSPSLAPATWVPVTNQPTQIGDQYVVPLPFSDPIGFYRLYHP
jgi:hypothetical protein